MNSCGGFVVEATSCLTSPGCVRQVNGVGVGVAGTGLGGRVAVAVAVEGIAVWVGEISFDDKQPESPARSAR
jgi:hypothetical protein